MNMMNLNNISSVKQTKFYILSRNAIKWSFKRDKTLHNLLNIFLQVQPLLNYIPVSDKFHSVIRYYMDITGYHMVSCYTLCIFQSFKN